MIKVKLRIYASARFIDLFTNFRLGLFLLADFFKGISAPSEFMSLFTAEFSKDRME